MKASPGGFVRFSDSLYYADLVNGGSYTPAASFIGMFANEDGNLDSDRVRMQGYDGSGQVNLNASVAYQSTIFFIQDTAQTLRIANNAGVAMKIWFVGVIWS